VSPTLELFKYNASSEVKKLEDEARLHIQSKVQSLLKMRSTAATSEKDPLNCSFDFDTPPSHRTADCSDDTLADINTIQPSASKVRMTPVRAKLHLGVQIAQMAE